MALSKETVAAWLDAYVQAWKSYDPEAIGALFAEDATYAYHPWDEPVHGRGAITASWLEDQDAPGSWAAHYEPLAVDGNVAIATGQSRYFGPDGSLLREFYNCYVIRFDDDGRCSSFTEWYMEKPNPASDYSG
jgi:ketosteroid isomerase-like protein